MARFVGKMGREHPGLPDDLLNFRYDPLACVVAAGWDGAVYAAMMWLTVGRLTRRS